MTSFESALENLDVQLFKTIKSQTRTQDKRSLLACQVAMRSLGDGYVYLEIGSHLGGSLQPYVLDPLCRRIYSIDKRPLTLPDERGGNLTYYDNSTERMMENIKRVSEDGAKKIVCIDADASEIPVDTIDPKPRLCFVDGEHTDRAVVRDFGFCRRVIAPDGAVLFHDAHIVYLRLEKILKELEQEKVVFRAYHLPDVVFVIEFGECRLHANPAIQHMLVNNHVGYLASLKLNDHFRAFTNRPIFKALRGIKAQLATVKPVLRRVGAIR